MLRKKDEVVKFTKGMLSNAPFDWVAPLKDKPLKIVSCKLSKICSFAIYKVSFFDGNRLLFLDMSADGKLVNNGNIYEDEVFEDYFSGDLQDEPEAYTPLVLEETNSKCPICGSPALDLIFSVKCTNKGCRNYK